MKIFRILLAALLVVAMVMPLASCSYNLSGNGGLSVHQEETETVTEEENDGVKEKAPKYSLYQNEDKIRILNQRSVFTEEGELGTDWGGSGVEVCINVAEGGSAFSLESRSNHTTEWKVILDGEVAIERIKIGSGKKNTVLFEHLEEGIHTIRIVKESQIAASSSNYNSLLSVSFFGEMLEAEGQRELYVEFLGDAVFAGYGALGSTTASAEIDAETSATASIPYLVGEMLGADVAIIARSGVGLSSKVAGLIGSTMYDNQLGWRDRDVRLFVPSRTPDAVVIHLGEDDTYSALSVGEFVRQAELLVNHIRSYYGDENIPVVWVYGCRFITWREGELKALQVKMGEGAEFYPVKLNYGASGSSPNSATARYPDREENVDNAMLVADYLSQLLNGESILEELEAEWNVPVEDVTEAE